MIKSKIRFLWIVAMSILLAMSCKNEVKITDKDKILIIIKNTNIPNEMRSNLLIGTVKHPYSYGCNDAFNKSEKIVHGNDRQITAVEILIPKICLKTATFDSARTIIFEKDSLAEIDFYYSSHQAQSTKIKDTLFVNNVSIRRFAADE